MKKESFFKAAILSIVAAILLVYAALLTYEVIDSRRPIYYRNIRYGIVE